MPHRSMASQKQPWRSNNLTRPKDGPFSGTRHMDLEGDGMNEEYENLCSEVRQFLYHLKITKVVDSMTSVEIARLEEYLLMFADSREDVGFMRGRELERQIMLDEFKRVIRPKNN